MCLAAYARYSQYVADGVTMADVVDSRHDESVIVAACTCCSVALSALPLVEMVELEVVVDHARPERLLTHSA